VESRLVDNGNFTLVSCVFEEKQTKLLQKRAKTIDKRKKILYNKYTKKIWKRRGF
jgi:hypothetical protein